MSREKSILNMNPLHLAYIGDAVYALLVRETLVENGGKLKDIHRHCTSLVCACSQANTLAKIMPILTDEEADIVRRARNTHAKHAVPRSATAYEYAQSTAFEALIGYLHLAGRDNRILELLQPLFNQQPEE